MRDVEELIRERVFLPGGRYLYASGRSLHQTQNCLLLRASDSREGWSDIVYKATMALMTGAGIGIDYGDVRPSGSSIGRTGGQASGPISLMQMVNEAGRHIQQGGARRSAIWAGLPWSHPDVEDFIRLKDWPQDIVQRKEEDFNSPAPLDMTNVSVQLDDEFFAAYGDPRHPMHDTAHRIYRLTVSHMVRTAEPGFSVDVGADAGETLRNACTEVTSATDSDICNLGSGNLSRISTPAEMAEVVDRGALFLLAGTCYSHVPYPLVEEVRTMNRRLGLGLMGVHEWLVQRGRPYGPDSGLEDLLTVYAQATAVAHRYADLYGLSRPVKTRAIAPTGTIGIIGETTTGIEPIFCKAYKRRYKEARAGVTGDITHYQYVVDPTARRAVEAGIPATDIQDAYSIDPEDRIAFQAWVQQFVDHGVSSTINLPGPITDEAEVLEFGNMLMKYLPKLRGITCYPNGARGGQPLTPIPYELAIQEEGVVFTEEQERCVGGACGV